MSKLKYILILLVVALISSCEQDYDLEVDMSDTYPAYIIVSNSSDVVVSETKSFTLILRRYIPMYEDVTVDWKISGEGITDITGSEIFPANDGAVGAYIQEFTIDIPASVVPEGELSVDATLELVSCSAASGKEVAAGFNGEKNTLGVTINKYVPLDRSLFTGAYTEDDGSAQVNVTISEDPDDEFGLIISNIWDWSPDAKCKVVFNTITSEVNVAEQESGWEYPGYGMLMILPKTPVGTFNLSDGSFSINVDFYLPSVDHSFTGGGGIVLNYTRQ